MKKQTNLHLGWLKGIVHPKMKILSSFTHSQVVPNLYIVFILYIPVYILQNIFLCVQQNKDIHTGLELLEGE